MWSRGPQTNETGRVLQIWTLLLIFICSAQLVVSQRGPFNTDPEYTFVHDAIGAPAIASYDYIIVGGGTAGCPLAATLSTGNYTVLLLERGGQPYRDETVMRRDQFGTIQQQATVHATTAGQKFVSEDGVVNLRANVLGGGSAVSAGFYTYASRRYMQARGWDEGLVNQSYAWVERIVGHFPREADWQSGVGLGPRVGRWQNALEAGLPEANIIPFNYATNEHIMGTKVGGEIFDEQGIRHSAADLLQYANPEMLTVYTLATVEQILLRPSDSTRNKEAYGVRYRDALGRVHTATTLSDDHRGVRGEVILSAGALGSPQLLLLSGIGPVSKLSPLGIDVIVPLEGVGDQMADNPANAMFVPSPNPVESSLIQVVGITQNNSFIEGVSGWSNLGLTRGSLNTLDPVNRTLSLSQQYNDILSGLNPTVQAQLAQGGLIFQQAAGPRSTGTLWLNSTDVRVNPAVRFNYYQSNEDVLSCIEGLRRIDSALRSEAFRNFRYEAPEDIPSDVLTNMYLIGDLPPSFNVYDTELAADWCRRTVVTSWNYHGGCQLDYVVDETSHRVGGVDALRVIDGSNWITSPGANPQATVMMIGRYMGVRILQERFDDEGY